METFWITKYSATRPIFSIEGKAEYEDFLNGGWWVKHPENWMHYRQTEAFRDKAEAEADADRRRAKKVESLKKQIAKIEKLRGAA